MKSKHQILLTGGHGATTALAFIQELKDDSNFDWDISWIGPRQALSDSNLLPFEIKLFSQLGVHVYSITAGKLQKKVTRFLIPNLLKIPLGFWQAFWIIYKLKPEVVLSFGGFVSVPVVFISYLFGIPIIIQEQTLGAGLANKLMSRFATKIAVSRKESLVFFPSGKVSVIGNPITKEIRNLKPKNKISRSPTILIMGGSRGAQRINNLVFEAISKLILKFNVIHLTGKIDYQKSVNVQKKLPITLRNKYVVYDFINPTEINKQYEKADIIVGRAGANAVSEGMYLKIPSIYIPIPWSIGDEQLKNAKFAEKVGCAFVLKEEDMSSESLMQKINEVELNWTKMNKSAEKVKDLDVKATDKLLDIVHIVIE